MSGYRFRLATEADSPQILALYTPVVQNTIITFEQEVPTLEAFRTRVRNASSTYPFLLCETDSGELAAFSYAAPYKARAAYSWSVELSIYVSSAYQRRGLAGALYTRLLALLRLQGCRNAFACITHPNEPSERFHAAMGFEAAGLFRRAGFKHGMWRDVAWMQKNLLDSWCNPDSPPDPFKPIGSLDPMLVERILLNSVQP